MRSVNAEERSPLLLVLADDVFRGEFEGDVGGGALCLQHGARARAASTGESKTQMSHPTLAR